jgi:Leucine-rich repeat (LRR) protein
MKYLKNFKLFESATEFYINSSNKHLLDNLSDDVKILNCNSIELKNLSKLPKNLIELYCKYNYLSELPELPNSLTSLYCNNNKLTELPGLPDSLEYLDCYSDIISDNFNNFENIITLHTNFES